MKQGYSFCPMCPLMIKQTTNMNPNKMVVEPSCMRNKFIYERNPEMSSAITSQTLLQIQMKPVSFKEIED